MCNLGTNTKLSMCFSGSVRNSSIEEFIEINFRNSSVKLCWFNTILLNAGNVLRTNCFDLFGSQWRFGRNCYDGSISISNCFFRSYYWSFQQLMLVVFILHFQCFSHKSRVATDRTGYTMKIFHIDWINRNIVSLQNRITSLNSLFEPTIPYSLFTCSNEALSADFSFTMARSLSWDSVYICIRRLYFSFPFAYFPTISSYVCCYKKQIIINEITFGILLLPAHQCFVSVRNFKIIRKFVFFCHDFIFFIDFR